ncbi:hypothetical protein ACWG8W_08680 [Citricoccus zhacaiensis]
MPSSGRETAQQLPHRGRLDLHDPQDRRVAALWTAEPLERGQFGDRGVQLPTGAVLPDEGASWARGCFAGSSASARDCFATASASVEPT